MLRWCPKGVEIYFEGVSRVFQECFKGALMMSHGCFKGVLNVLQGCLKSVSGTFK